MSHTKRISKRTSLRLKKAATQPIQPGEVPPAPLRDRAQAARIASIREVISAAGYDLDAAFARAVTKLIEREIG